MLKIEEYLDKFIPYLSDIINDQWTQGKWKIQLTITNNFISSKDSEEMHALHFKRDNKLWYGWNHWNS